MGKDNQPKERQRKDLERKRGNRASYDRILIICEGKTESLYFEEIRQHYRLHTANVQVKPSELGSAPRLVVEYAHDLFVSGDTHRHLTPRAFEQVYAVFDRDAHISYHDALNLAASLNGKLHNDLNRKVLFNAVASVPCFELWLLLHYEDIRHPLHRDEVQQRLKHYLLNYKKGESGYFALTRHLSDIANQRATRLNNQTTPYDGNQPYTNIKLLFELLVSLSRH